VAHVDAEEANQIFINFDDNNSNDMNFEEFFKV